MTDVSFPDAVAKRSGHPVQDVTKLLTAVRVPTTDTVGAPHRLRVTRLKFTGKKAGKLSGDIDFDQELGNGLWALSTAKNDRGKTSILEIIMWCLRGHPKRLQDDVRSWLHTVALEGTVDDEAFLVSFNVTNGMPNGALTCGTDVRPFGSDAAFADTMSQFMMERLGFESFTQWVDGQGPATHHWPSYSAVLYLPREAEDAVIGDLAGVGLAQRLVLLFVGIRWARTLVASQAALREARARAAEHEAEQETLQRAATGTVAVKKAELEAAMKKIASLPSDLPTDEQIAAAKASWMALISQHGNVTVELAEAQRDAKAARREAAGLRKRLTDLTEAALARRLFHGLDPANCPRCSTAIDTDRKQAEKIDRSCAVCARELDLELEAKIDDVDISEEDADEPESAESLERLVADLNQVAATEQARTDTLTAEARRLAEELATAEALLETYANQAVQVEQRRVLQTQATALEAVITELNNLAGEAAQPTVPDPGAAARLEILEAAVTEAKARVDAGFAEVTDQVNAAILDLAQRFGFETLEDARLNLAAQLRLVKGGTNTSFSKQTPGEKLRLRIAVIAALLRVAHQHGVGRHPGLLLIDSIGAEETEPGDLSQFMRELEMITDEMGIETIVASARPEILAHVPSSQQVVALGDDYLW